MIFLQKLIRKIAFPPNGGNTRLPQVSSGIAGWSQSLVSAEAASETIGDCLCMLRAHLVASPFGSEGRSSKR